MKKLFIAITITSSLLGMHSYNSPALHQPTGHSVGSEKDRFYLDIKNDTGQEVTIYCHKYYENRFLGSEHYLIKKDWLAKFVIYNQVTHFILTKQESNPSIEAYLTEKFEPSNDCSAMSKPIKHSDNTIFATNFNNSNFQEFVARKISEILISDK